MNLHSYLQHTFTIETFYHKGNIEYTKINIVRLSKPDLTNTCPEIDAAFATEVVNTLSAEAPTLATVTVVTSVKHDPNKYLL